MPKRSPWGPKNGPYLKPSGEIKTVLVDPFLGPFAGPKKRTIRLRLSCLVSDTGWVLVHLWT